MSDVDDLKARITKAFANVEPPPEWSLVNSREGEEPYLLEQEFKGLTDWRNLEPAFLDRAPDGYGTALSFFSDEAFHFYLPAFLLADLDDALMQSDPVFHLTLGLSNDSRNSKINPRRYGERTWFDHARHKFSMFSPEESEAIAAYLTHKRDRGNLTEFEKTQITEALESYWIDSSA